MNNTFRMGQLKDIIEFNNGKAIKKNGGSIPIFGGNGVLGYCSKHNYENTLIIGRVGAYCGSVHISNNKCWVSDNAIAALPKESSSNLYNYYLLTSLNLNALRIGSSQPLLTQGILKNVSVKIEFDKVKQKNLASILAALDEKIELNNQINTELEAMAKTLYEYWFVQFDFPNVDGKPYKSTGGKMVYNETLKQEIPEKWKACELGDYIEFKRGISYKGTDIKDNGVPFLNLNSFSLSGQFKLAGTKYFSGNFKKESKLNVGDLVIAITDVTRNADITGKAFVIPDIFEEQPLISCDVAAVFSETFTVGYLEQLFNSDSYHSYIKNYATGTLVLHLNLNGVSWFKTTLPPMTLLNRYEDYCKSLFKQRNITLKENIHLEELRDWLLPMLMNGQVTVS